MVQIVHSVIDQHHHTVFVSKAKTGVEPVKAFLYRRASDAKAAANSRAQKRIGKANDDVSLASIAANAKNGERPQLNLIIKADTQGSAEALKSSLAKIEVPGTKLTIVHTASGEVNQSDITLASASHSVILAFDIKVSQSIKDLAQKTRLNTKPEKSKFS